MSSLLLLPGEATSALADLLAVAAGKGTVVVLLAALVSAVMARSTASARHLVWTATLAGLLFLPLISAVAPSLPLPLLPRLPEVGDLLADPPGGVRPAPFETVSGPAGAAGPDWPRLVTMIYLAGVVASWAYFATGFFGVRRLMREARLRSDLREWRSLQARPGRPRAARNPVLVTSTGLSAPVTWGLWRPTILLPAAATDWSARELRHALLHELAHVERRDWAARLLAHLVCSLYWFHPLVWLAARRQALESERACDDRVLASGAESSEYASQLLTLARNVRRATAGRTAAVSMVRRSQLGRRIQSVLDPRRRRSSLGPVQRRLLFVLACLPAVLLGPLSLVRAGWHERSGDRPILHAAAAGDAAAVAALVASGADVNSRLAGDGSPLIVAARGGHRDAARALLDRGADIDLGVRGDGNPLIAAARVGQLEMVRLLIDGGADIERVVPGDENALIQAAGAGQLEVVRYLIARGADVNARVSANRREIRTPLSQARRGRHAAVVDLLLAAGARH